jgi:integrase
MPKFSPSADRLTKTAIAQLSTAEARYRVRDVGCEGLYLVVEPSGRKHWIVRYPGERGVQREKGLGAYPIVLPEQARAQAVAIRGAVAREGADPVKEARTAKAEARRVVERAQDDTFRALSALYFTASETGWHGHRPKAASTLDKERSNWAKHLEPAFGARAYAEIKRGDVIARIEQIGRTSGPGAANTALEVIRQIFTYAEFKELIEVHPAVRIPKFHTEARDVVANEMQLRKLWLELDRIRHGKRRSAAHSARAVQLALLTMQRRGEIARMERSHIDIERQRWEIPRENKKERRRSVTPLSDWAMEIAREAIAETNGEFLFPARALGGVSNGPIDPHSLTTFMRRLRARLRIRDITVHDLRRTGRTMLTDDERFDGEGVDEATAERVLNHRVGSDAQAAYDWNAYLGKKRRALELWAGELKRIVYGEVSTSAQFSKAAVGQGS